MRAEIPPPVDPDLTVEARSIQLVRRFDNEDKSRAFDDAGDGTTYAQWFADLLEEWISLEHRRR